MAISITLPRCLITEEYGIDPKLVPKGATPRYETDSSMPAVTQHADPAMPVIQRLLREVRSVPTYGLIDRIELFHGLPDNGKGLTLFNNEDELILHVTEARLGTTSPDSELGRLILHEFNVPDRLVNQLDVSLANQRYRAQRNDEPEYFSVAFSRYARKTSRSQPQGWSYVQFK